MNKVELWKYRKFSFIQHISIFFHNLLQANWRLRPRFLVVRLQPARVWRYHQDGKSKLIIIIQKYQKQAGYVSMCQKISQLFIMF